MRDRIGGVRGRRLGGLFVIGALVVGTAVGCSGSSGDGTSLGRLLDETPDIEASRTLLVYGNLARVRGDDPPENPKADAELLTSETGEVTVGWPFYIDSSDPTATEDFGFDLTDINASLELGLPPDLGTMLVGRFEPHRVGDTLTENPPFGGRVESGDTGDMDTYVLELGEEGDSGSQGDPDSLFGSNFVQISIGVSDDLLWFAPTEKAFDGPLRAADGSPDSLGDDATYRWAAEEFDAAEAHTAVLLGDPDRHHQFDLDALPEETRAEAQQMIDDGEMGLVRWEFAALADTPDGLMILLDHADAEAADKNADRLRAALENGRRVVSGERWSDLLDVDWLEPDGTRVVARLGTEKPLARQLPYAGDSLLLIVDTDR